MSIHIPLVNLDKRSCLKFVKGSQFLKEKSIRFEKFDSQVKKGSKSHKLGTPYDPKRISEKKYKFSSVPMKLGEYIFFTPALIRPKLNKNPDVTRFSIDVKVTSSFAPIIELKALMEIISIYKSLKYQNYEKIFSI